MTEKRVRISLTEFKRNLNHSIELSAKTPVYLTSYGRAVAKLADPFSDRVKIADSLYGVIPADMTAEEARAKRLKKICECCWIPLL